MPVMTFILTDGTSKRVDAPFGLSVMEIAQKNDIDAIEGSCGGSLACATCHVYVHPDWWTRCLPGAEAGAEDLDAAEVSEEEEDMLDLAFKLRKCSRLSCQIIMSAALDGLVVALPGADVDWV